MHGLRFKQIYRVVFKIFEKAFKIENCAKFIMAVLLRKSLVLGIKRAQTNKTFMASRYKFNAHFRRTTTYICLLPHALEYIFVKLLRLFLATSWEGFLYSRLKCFMLINLRKVLHSSAAE